MILIDLINDLMGGRGGGFVKSNVKTFYIDHLVVYQEFFYQIFGAF